jgi:mycothiol synthase
VTPAEVRLRPAVPGDAAGVAALINQRELIDRGVTEVTAAEVTADWAAPEIELAADGLTAESGGQIVGTALATRDREFVYVATDHEGRGLGAELLRWVVARSVARRAVRHRQIIGSDNARAAALLTAAGYARTRGFHRMQGRLPAGPPAPTEVAIRTVDPERDAHELHQLDAAAFADNADYESETFEQFRAEHLSAPDVDRGATLAALDGDRIVGYLVGARRRGGEVGYVSILGVDPAARRRGIATALLDTAFGIWRADGVELAELTVASDNPRAIALYEGLGMRRVYTLDSYERPISTAG